MTLSYKTLLTLSCVSFSLCAMEPQTSLTTHSTTFTQPQSNQKNYYALNDIYKKASFTLQSYNPTDRESIKNIFEIIAAVEALQKKGINDTEFGAFAYKQPSNHSFFFENTIPHHNSTYTSVFFERITRHNNHIKKNNFTLPTLEEFIRYKKNKSNEAAITTAAHFNIFINLKNIDPNNTVIVDLPHNIKDGIEEIEKLINDIKAIQDTSPETITAIATILYRPKL